MINNDLHHRSSALISYRSVTGKYIHGAQKMERALSKKVGWLASSIFTHFAGCGLPLAGVASLLYDPIKRLQNKGYAHGTNQCKQLLGDLFTVPFGTIGTVVFGCWMPTDLNLEIINNRDDQERVIQCLKVGADPNLYSCACCGCDLTYPLGDACIRGDLEVVKALIDAQVDLNCTMIQSDDEVGGEEMSPLQLTIHSFRPGFCSERERLKRIKIFRALLDAGAVIQKSSELFDLAIERGFGEIVDLLLDKGLKHRTYDEIDLVLRCNLSHRIPHVLPEHLYFRKLRPAIVAGSWEALHLIWKRFKKDSYLDKTLIGKVIHIYLEGIVYADRLRKDLGCIGPFLQEALSHELPYEREKILLKELMNKVMSLGNPQDNLFYICAFLFPDAYEEWIKGFPNKDKEPGKKEAIAAIVSSYQVVVKNYVEKEKADHFCRGSLLDLSDIVRSYILPDPGNDEGKNALCFFNPAV